MGRSLSPEECRRLKQRRRTLKNRGYAASCRIKRLTQKEELDLERVALQKEVDRITQENERMKIELEDYQKKLYDLREFSKSVAADPQSVMISHVDQKPPGSIVGISSGRITNVKTSSS